MVNKQCAYRKQAYDCTHPTTRTIEGAAKEICPLCLLGQQTDAIELQTSAISNLTASMEEAIITGTEIKEKIKTLVSLEYVR